MATHPGLHTEPFNILGVYLKQDKVHSTLDDLASSIDHFTCYTPNFIGHYIQLHHAQPHPPRDAGKAPPQKGFSKGHFPI